MIERAGRQGQGQQRRQRRQRRHWSAGDLDDLRLDTYSLLAEIVSLPPGIDPGYLRSLHSSIAAAQLSEQTQTSLALLPIYACYAVGGEPRSAIPVAAAWRALHLAAKLLDDVEDGEVPAQPDGTPDTAAGAHSINRATGLFSAAGLALLRLEAVVRDALLPAFYNTILVMSSAQHIDLAGRIYSLDDYLNVATAKAGRFFALATAAGARCGTDEERHISLLDKFGFNAGIFLQIADDYLDWHKPGPGDVASGRVALPACYVRSAGTEEQHSSLERLLAQARSGGPAAQEARAEAQRLAGEAGADAYMLAELVRYRHRALAALEELEHLGLDTQPLAGWFSRVSAFVSKWSYQP